MTDKVKSVQGLGKIAYSIELRDLFAMHAMSTMVGQFRFADIDGDLMQSVAQEAYAIADAMLKARENKETPG